MLQEVLSHMLVARGMLTQAVDDAHDDLWFAFRLPGLGKNRDAVSGFKGTFSSCHTFLQIDLR
jgi:hypothetical protein